MKKQSYTMVGVLVLITMFTVSIAKAQSASQRFTAKIPFAFSISNQTLPAGEYEITIANPSSDQRVLRVRNLTTNESVMLKTHDVIGRARGDAKLVFRAYGEHYFLAQAWSGVDNNGLEAPRSRAEKATNNELASIQQRLEMVRLERASR